MTSQKQFFSVNNNVVDSLSDERELVMKPVSKKYINVYAKLCQLSLIDYVTGKNETKEQRRIRTGKIDRILDSAVDPSIGFIHRCKYVESISVPGMLDVLQQDDLELTIIVVSGPFTNRFIKGRMLSTVELYQSIHKINEDLLNTGVKSSNKKKKNKNKQKNNMFTKYIDEVAGIIENRDQLVPTYRYAFVGYSFGASALYYMLLASHPITKRLYQAHLFAPVTNALVGVKFRRKLHPDVINKIHIYKNDKDILSDNAQYLKGLLHLFSGYKHRARSLSAHILRRPSSKLYINSKLSQKYYDRFTIDNMYNLMQDHQLTHFYMTPNVIENYY